MSKIVDYDKLLEANGDSPLSLGWSLSGQTIRFAALLDCIRTQHADDYTGTVLDVGAGLGHLAHWLPRAGYTAVEENARMVARMQEKKLRVLQGDALSMTLPRADYVFSSGMLNITSSPNEPDAIYNLISKCYTACHECCAVNMLSAMVPFADRQPGRRYRQPDNVLAYVSSLTKKFQLRHDYLENDFTVYLWK